MKAIRSIAILLAQMAFVLAPFALLACALEALIEGRPMTPGTAAAVLLLTIVLPAALVAGLAIWKRLVTDREVK